MAIRGKGSGGQERVKVAKYMAMEGLTLGGGHAAQPADDVLQKWAPETHIISLTCVSPIN